MTDIETAVRQMLHDGAISVPTATAPPSLLRRARLRRLRNGSGSALAVVALIVAGSVTVSRLGEPDRVNVVTRPSPTTLTPPTAAVPPTAVTTVPPAPTVSTTAPQHVEAIVDSGSGPGGQWRLKAYRDGAGPACASVTQAGQETGATCFAGSEQDGNGDDVVRYAVAGIPEARYVVGVTRADVATVRAELVGGAVVERATATHPSFATNRFVVVFLPPDAVIRALSALDRSGRQLTRIVINP